MKQVFKSFMFVMYLEFFYIFAIIILEVLRLFFMGEGFMDSRFDLVFKNFILEEMIDQEQDQQQ